MKKLLLVLTGLFLSCSFLQAQTFQWGGKLEGNNGSRSAVTKALTANGNYYVTGWYTDSVQLDLIGSEGPLGYTLPGSTPGVKHRFVAKYDNFGDLQWAFPLGTATDSVVLNDMIVDDYNGRVYIGGTLYGTVNFDPYNTPYTISSGISPDAFFAAYDDISGWLLNSDHAYVLSNSGSTAGVNGLAFDYSGYLYITGHFDGTIDVNPDAGLSANLSAVAGTDVFMVKYDVYDFTNVLQAQSLPGAGDEAGVYITLDNYGGFIITGHFNNNIDLDWDTPAVTKTSAGGFDVFQVRYSFSFNYMSGLSIGGTGNDFPRGITSTDDYNNDMVLLTEFQNTVNLDPAGTFNVSSAGSNDVAVSRYGLNGSFKYGKSWGNAGNNKGYFLVKAPEPIAARSTSYGHVYVGFGFSGTVDLDPDAAVENISSGNTPVNTAIVELDSLLNKVTSMSVEAQNTASMVFDYYSGTRIMLAGSFSGTAVDVMPYAGVQPLTHTTSPCGFISYFDECQLDVQVVMPYPYECGTCNAALTVQVQGALDGLYEVSWSGGDAGYGQTVTGLCPGSYSVLVEDGHGCYWSSNDDYVILEHPADSLPYMVITPNPSTCNNNFGSASAAIFNAVAPYSITWSNGDTATVADSLAAGVYTVTVQDSLGCFVKETFSINDSDGPVITVNTTSNPTCSGGSGSIDITVTGGVAPLTYQWSNGAGTEDLINVPEGTYALIVTDANGCQSQVCVTLSSPSPVEITAINISSPTSCGAADGTIGIDVEGGTAPYTYLWNDPLAQTTDSALALSAGLYTVTITDAMGCTSIKKVPFSDYTGPYIDWYYYYSPSCQDPNGFIETSIWGWTPITFLWEDASTNEDLYGITEGGTFYQQATDFNGCKSVFYYEVPQILPNTPDLCMVSVDETGTQNVVVWDKTTTPEAVSYNIYREGFCSSTDFLPIGNVSSDSLSVFYDTVVNTETKSWQYYITAIDTCGYESLPSEVNKTIHLTSNFTATMEVELNWEAYVGRIIDQYDIFRSTAADSTIFTQIDSVAGTVLTYTDNDDLSAYAGHNVEYYIEAIPQNPCYATRAFNQNASRSNHTRLGLAGEPVDTTGTQDVPGIEELVRIFPNPANDLLNISVTGSKTQYTAAIMNSVGQTVHTYSFNRSAVISTAVLPNGVYYVQMTNNEQKTKVFKLVISH